MYLKIKRVEWGSGNRPTEIYFYTNNPFGNLRDDGGLTDMPFFKAPNRLLSSSADVLNSKIQLKLYEAAIREIYPDLDTNGGDLAL